MANQRIGTRIHISQSKGRWMATISSDIPTWQRQSLELWSGAWLGLGILLAYGVWSHSESEAQFYAICLAFWSYFALKAWRAVRWRRGGMEVIQLGEEGLQIRMDHGAKQGNAPWLPWEVLQSAEVIPINPKSLLQSGEQQFWVVGGERLQISVGSKIHRWGKQLSNRDAEALCKSYNAALKQLRPQA
ncbi:MAG: hypothetical protein O2791_01230 [Bacteroidetes bacterium]|jgi:hypothetical protein|nr:hypothetical protein [Bacteroidota bacterium]